MEDWEEGVKETWHPEFDYILKEIDRLFDEERKRLEEPVGKRRIRKNLLITRIYLPTKDFKFMEEYPPFKDAHSLGGIPCILVREGPIRIDTEVVDPRKRKRKTIVYVTKDRI